MNPTKKLNTEVDTLCTPETRIPLSKQKILGYVKEPGWDYYLANDVYDEIMAMRAAGWEHVIGSNGDTHSGLSQVETSTGSYITRVVNKNSKADCHLGVLMRIRKEFRDADYTAEQAQIAEDEKQIKQNGLHTQENHYGEFIQKIGT
jgi:hypothetical protein